MRASFSILAVAGSLVGIVAPASAQSSDESRTWSIGAFLGLPYSDGEVQARLFAVAAHITQIDSKKLGLDVALGTMPRVAADGDIPLGARLGVVLPISIGSVAFVVPAGGGGVIGLFGDDTANTAFTLHLGASVVIRHRPDVRFGLFRHRVSDGNPPVWAAEFGVLWQ